MTLLHSLRMIFRLAAAAALLAVAEAGPSFMPGRAGGGNRLADPALLVSPAHTQPGRSASEAAGSPATPRLQNFARIPLSFEANEGQTDPQVQYLARGPGYTLFLTSTEAVLALNPGGPAVDSPRSPLLRSGKSGIADAALRPPEERRARG